MECKKDIGGKFKFRSTSKFNYAKVISTTCYVNCLFITNPQGHRLSPNSMTTVVQSAVQPFQLTWNISAKEAKEETDKNSDHTDTFE